MLALVLASANATFVVVFDLAFAGGDRGEWGARGEWVDRDPAPEHMHGVLADFFIENATAAAPPLHMQVSYLYGFLFTWDRLARSLPRKTR